MFRIFRFRGSKWDSSFSPTLNDNLRCLGQRIPSHDDRLQRTAVFASRSLLTPTQNEPLASSQHLVSQNERLQRLVGKRNAANGGEGLLSQHKGLQLRNGAEGGSEDVRQRSLLVLVSKEQRSHRHRIHLEEGHVLVRGAVDANRLRRHIVQKEGGIVRKIGVDRQELKRGKV